MTKATVLIVDDKPNIRKVLAALLENEGYNTVTSESADKALLILNTDKPDLVITDLKMPGMDGITFIKNINKLDRNIPVIMITAFGTISSAVEAIKAGGYDYLTKPIDYERLKIVAAHAIEQIRLNKENKYLKKELNKKNGFDNFIGNSDIIVKMFSLIETVAPSNSSVLIQGECGTGKELIAKAIYQKSSRNNSPFIVVDCSALPEGLLESELFGYEKGAFTGADSRKIGRIELADSGTLFLDEIGEMDLSIQAKLLRVIQERQFTRVGGLESIKIDFRLITASNRDLGKEIKAGKFRSDLYYRINVITIKSPPLRERLEDIPILISFFIDRICSRDNKVFKSISPECVDLLLKYQWPGNVRELENCVERMIIISKDDVVTSDSLPSEIIEASSNNYPSVIVKDPFSLNDIEKNVVIKALEKAGWNKTEAAKLLKINRKVLYTKIKKYHLHKTK